MNPALHRLILYTLTVIFNCLASTQNCHYLCLLCLNAWGSNKAFKSITLLSSLPSSVGWLNGLRWQEKGTSIHLLLQDSGSQGALELIPTVFSGKWGSIRDKSPVHCRASNSGAHSCFRVPSLLLEEEFGANLKLWRRKQREHENSHPDIKSVTLLTLVTGLTISIWELIEKKMCL